MRVDGFGGRRKVVGVVAALFVKVDRDLRLILERDLDAATRLGLRLHEPITVHVEEVVIGTAAGPRLIVLGAVPGGVRRGGEALHVLKDEARPTVGVLHRIDQHERVALDEVDALVALRREQVIGLQQRGIG